MQLKPELLTVLENKRTAPGHYRLRFVSRRIARAAKAGQFVQIMVSDQQDPLLPRPFSFLEVGRDWFDLLYQVVGRGTEILSKRKKGDTLTVLGPLGCGWRLPSAAKDRTGLAVTHVLVGGGVGIPPLHHWAQELLRVKKIPAGRIKVFLGGRSREYVHCQKQFLKMGIKPVVSTDDGSLGIKGFVTNRLEDFLSNMSLRGASATRQSYKGSVLCEIASGASRPRTDLQIYTCGPTPMLKAVSALAAKYSVPCQVSVEEPMPCGFGVCLGCAIKVKTDDGGHRFALSCTEGPVFDAGRVCWS